MSVTETRLITIVQAAEIIGLSRSKLYELLASRELPSVHIGRARRIDVADLERFIARHRVPERAHAGDVPGLAGQNEEASR
jgi:excisionase family DNA binding protein